MLLFIILFILLLLGIGAVILDKRTFSDSFFNTGMILIILSAVGLVVFGGLAIKTAVIKDIEYQDTLAQREMLEYRLENATDLDVGNEMLYSEINELNSKVRHHKKWAVNPWTNWFFNEKIASLDFIDYHKE